MAITSESELLTREFEDETGTTRTLTRTEIMMYLMLISGAGNETTTVRGWESLPVFTSASGR